MFDNFILTRRKAPYNDGFLNYFVTNYFYFNRTVKLATVRAMILHKREKSYIEEFDQFKEKVYRFHDIYPTYMTSKKGWFVVDESQVEAINIKVNKDTLICGVILAGAIENEARINSIYLKKSVGIKSKKVHIIKEQNQKSKYPISIKKVKNLLEFKPRLLEKDAHYTLEVQYIPYSRSDINYKPYQALQLFHGNPDAIKHPRIITDVTLETVPSQFLQFFGNLMLDIEPAELASPKFQLGKNDLGGPILGFFIYDCFS